MKCKGIRAFPAQARVGLFGVTRYRASFLRFARRYASERPPLAVAPTIPSAWLLKAKRRTKNIDTVVIKYKIATRIRKPRKRRVK